MSLKGKSTTIRTKKKGFIQTKNIFEMLVEKLNVFLPIPRKLTLTQPRRPVELLLTMKLL